MKKWLLLSILIVSGNLSIIYGQKIGNLNGIYYQAVAIDENGKEIVGSDIAGKPVYQKAIGVKFTITKGLNGSIQWEETHTTTTDKFGLFNLIIGQGTSTANKPFAKMLDIPWIDADQFLKVELSTKNDGVFKLVSNQKFMTVPYSFYTDDIADNAITTFKILDSAILNQDINTSSVDSRTLLNETIQAEDIDTSAVTTSEILDSTIINRDIQTRAVDSRTILDSTVINRDIQTGAVDSRTVLDSNLVNQDIKSEAIDSRTILDSTIINRDIKTSTVDSRTVLDSTLINRDLRTESIDSRTILDSTILDRDIADSTINLVKKVTGILGIQNGGTGRDTLPANGILLGNITGPVLSLGQAKPGQIPVGTDSIPHLKLLTSDNGIQLTFNADSIIVTTRIQTIFSLNVGTISPGLVFSNNRWVSDLIPVEDVEMGSIVQAAIDTDLRGCLLTAYVAEPNRIRIIIDNDSGIPANLGEDRKLKIVVIR